MRVQITVNVKVEVKKVRPGCGREGGAVHRGIASKHCIKCNVTVTVR